MVCPPVCVEFLLLLLVCFQVLLFPLLEEGAVDHKEKVWDSWGPGSTGFGRGDGDEAEGKGPLGRKLGIAYDIQGFCKDTEENHRTPSSWLS